MNPPYPVVAVGATTEEVSKHINKDNAAVLVDLGDGKFHIITKYDLISAMAYSSNSLWAIICTPPIASLGLRWGPHLKAP